MTSATDQHTAVTPPSPVVVRTYADLIDGLRTFVTALDVTFESIEIEAGLTEGHVAKLLSFKFVKCLGPGSLGPLLETLGAELVLRKRPDGEARRMRKRERPPVNWQERPR